MPQIPRERAPDSTLALLAEPYRYISRRALAHGSDVFEARILLQPTICMTGGDAAALFYDASRFTRVNAAPLRLRRTLFGRGGVQGLDGQAHTHRKKMLLAILSTERVAALTEQVEVSLHQQAVDWVQKGHVVLYDQMREALTRAVCRWAGLPLAEPEVPQWTERLSELFMGAGKMGPEHWRARAQRVRLEADLGTIIQDVREAKRITSAETALSILANHRDLKGDLLPARIAAIELLNILRPTVAIAVFITHLAHALHTNPNERRKLDDDAAILRFVQEVRRLYPFFPAVAARVRHTFEWNGHRFPAGRRVLLDLHGTNRDPRIWAEPHRFDPERFRGDPPHPFGFIPQGGGDVKRGHRCAGEETTLAILQMACRFFVHVVEYDVPPQDLEIDTSTTPALPKSGFIADVRHVDVPGLIASG